MLQRGDKTMCGMLLSTSTSFWKRAYCIQYFNSKKERKLISANLYNIMAYLTGSQIDLQNKSTRKRAEI